MKRFIETLECCFVAFCVLHTSWRIISTAVDWAVDKVFDSRDHDDETTKEKKERKKYITINKK